MTELKRVSFKVAKAIKEVGYPQGITRDVYVIKEGGKTCIEYPIGVCIASSVYECKDKFPSRKEATLAAIDKALEYLTKNNLIK